jgi:phenylalanyl-tRNA synthetase beta chain
MILIPGEYLKKYLLIQPLISWDKIVEKLTAKGLETKLICREENIYLEFTPFSNRPDLLSWWGIIREIGVLLNYRVLLPTLPVKQAEKKNSLPLIVATNNCSEFHLGLVKKVKIEESPLFIKKWLLANGIRSVNNIVDMANLVMLETGQPFHVFDYDNLPAKKTITVRSAKKNEKIVTFSGQELTLTTNDIVISTEKKIITLAGIIGSRENIITPRTKTLLIESASFSSQSIKNSVERLNISTRSGQYFSKEVNLNEKPLLALYHFLARLKELGLEGAKRAEIISVDRQSRKKREKTVTISEKFIKRKIGHSLPPSQLEEIWKRLNFSFAKKKFTYYLTPPFYRRDIILAEDIVEEILRIYDYNQVPDFSANFPKITNDNDEERWEKKQKIRTFLVNSGWQEIITYSLVSEKEKKGFFPSVTTNFYRALTPKSKNHHYYRQNLIPSHVKTIQYNLNHDNKDLFFFEIGSIYSLSASGEIFSEELLTLSATGRIFNQPLHNLVQEIDLFWIKGVLENIFTLFLVNEEISFVPPSLADFAQGIRTDLFLAKEKIGYLGIQKDNKREELIFLAQISVTRIFNFLAHFPPKIVYQPVSNFPKSEKDLSFFFPLVITDYNEIIKEIKSNGGSDLREVKIFDVYQNEELTAKGIKSVSFRLVFQSLVKTLEKSEIEKVIENINQKIIKLFKAEIRR